MKPIVTFDTIPLLPPKLEPLREVAHDVGWAWDHDAISLFRRLNSTLWEESGHNPVRMLGSIRQHQLDVAANDAGLIAHLDRVLRSRRLYNQATSTWYERTHGKPDGVQVAYFSAEFGITECLSIFAGGLGLLAGDHLKSASDLGVPLVGVGLMYQQGYFTQRLNNAGWQQEVYDENDFMNLPVTLARNQDGSPLIVSLIMHNKAVALQIWRVMVGRVCLYLLDANLPENDAEDRAITSQLYGGDLEVRLRQEYVLGIGGYRAVQALGLSPNVFHMNEGHSAFLALEHIRYLMSAHKASFDEAREAAAPGLIFTTHTPVPAGHDFFPRELITRYFATIAGELGLTMDEFLALGRSAPDSDGPFCTAVLAFRLCARSNAVSMLHGDVSRQMWQSMWPGVPVDEVPISSVTNGVHLESWISSEQEELYDRYLGPQWREEPANGAIWQQITRIPPDEWWRTHERRRERLVVFARNRLRKQCERSGCSQAELDACNQVLDPTTLTIGFARRFATYKRATLLLSDMERLKSILTNPERPVQIVFAGKAHPHDEQGKQLIRQIHALTKDEELRKRVVFLENYDMSISRQMVQGSDIWLNNPRRPLEACGTSGMKAAANGCLNVSVLDGWWDEAWASAGQNKTLIGWAIGRGEQYGADAEQDSVEAEALYDLLELDVIPEFYERRSRTALPMNWIVRSQSAAAALCPVYNSHRMVREYVEECYIPSAYRSRAVIADGIARARKVSDWKKRVSAAWPRVRIEVPRAENMTAVRVGENVPVIARVYTGGLEADDLRVEAFIGPLDSRGEIYSPEVTEMSPVGTASGEIAMYEVQAVLFDQSGRHGFTVRATPRHPDVTSRFLPGLIAWAVPAPEAQKK